MRWRVPLSCLLAVGLSLAPARATLQGDYLDIYLKLNDSERLEHNGDFRGALEGFEDCYAKLRKIHNSDPSWEPVLVTSRMEDCRAKIAELAPKVEASGPAPFVPGTNTPSVTSPTASGDTATLQERLQEVEQELAATKQQLADTQEKYKNSQIEVDTLHTQLDSVNQELAALKSSQSVDQNMGQLMAQNKELTDKLAAAQTEIKTLTSNPHSAAGKLAAQLKMVQEKLDASEAANAGLTETTTTLQQQLNKAQQDLATANNQLATTGPGSPQYLSLKHENEVMRGILLREIQEQSRRDGAKRLAQEEFDRLKITSRVLQEQLDILGSPMTPPNNDEERELLASIKVAPSEVTPLVDAGDNGGNHLSANTSGAPISENNPPSGTPPETNAAPATPPPATNAAPVATDTNAAPSATTNAPSVAATTNAAPATTTNAAPSTASTDTNAPAATNAAPAVATDTNAAPIPTLTNAPSTTEITNAAPPGPASTETNAPSTATTPSTNTPPAVTTGTNAAPATNTPAAAPETNATPASTAPTNAAPAVATDTNAAPAAASTNTVATTSTPGDTSASGQRTPDSARYSNQPRLPPDMHEVAQEATDLFENKHYDEAAAKYQTIIDKYPESLYAWSNLGVVRSQQGKLQEAMKALQQAVKLSPNDAFSYRNLGIVYYQLGQNDAAIDALERSIALDPSNVYSHDYLGCACSQKGWEEVAEKEFRKAIEIDDDFPDAHYNLAIVYAMQKPPMLELARRHYKRALELGLPKDPRLEKLLGL
jgi:Flp pilus assembly protein TadD